LGLGSLDNGYNFKKALDGVDGTQKTPTGSLKQITREKKKNRTERRTIVKGCPQKKKERELLLPNGKGPGPFKKKKGGWEFLNPRKEWPLSDPLAGRQTIGHSRDQI